MLADKSKTDNKLYLALYIIISLILISIFIYQAYSFSFYTIDDAYISFRYANNLVHGHGLVFNKGERVEGYTNFLFVIVLSLIIFFKGEPILASKLIGILSCLSIMITCLIIGWKKKKGLGLLALLAAILVCLFLEFNHAFIMWSIYGLETPLFTMLLFFSIGLLCLEGASFRHEITAYFLLALASLTRPEAIAITIVITLARIVAKPQSLKEIDFWKPILVYLLVFMPYFVWRYSYYGYLLPNTFYVKEEPSLGNKLKFFKTGFDYLRSYGARGGFKYLVLLVPFGFTYLNRQARIIILSIAGFYIAYLIYIGGDWMPFYRFLLPLQLAVFIVSSLGLIWIIRWLSIRMEILRYSGYALLCLLLALAFRNDLRRYVNRSQEIAFYPDKRIVFTYKSEYSTRSYKVAMELNKRYREGDTIAINILGHLPYYYIGSAYDPHGLVVPEIAHGPSNIKKALGKKKEYGLDMIGHTKYNLDYIINRYKPRYIIANLNMDLTEVKGYHPSTDIPGIFERDSANQ